MRRRESLKEKVARENRAIDVERWEWEHLHCITHWVEACEECRPPFRIKMEVVYR